MKRFFISGLSLVPIIMLIASANYVRAGELSTDKNLFCAVLLEEERGLIVELQAQNLPYTYHKVVMSRLDDLTKKAIVGGCYDRK